MSGLGTAAIESDVQLMNRDVKDTEILQSKIEHDCVLRFSSIRC